MGYGLCRGTEDAEGAGGLVATAECHCLCPFTVLSITEHILFQYTHGSVLCHSSCTLFFLCHYSIANWNSTIQNSKSEIKNSFKILWKFNIKIRIVKKKNFTSFIEKQKKEKK